jgi:ubiquinone biosynthesis protein
VADALDVVREIPYDLGVIFRQAKKGKFKIEFEHVGLEAMRKTISRATNRLSLTILIAALLISSSMVVIAGVRGSMVGSIPLLAFIGYIFAVFFSMLLAISVWFHSD